METSFTKGVVMPGRHEDEIMKHFVGSSNLVEHYFCILLSQITWFGDQVAI